MLLKMEMNACSQQELVNLCQSLVDSGFLSLFEHPLRRACFDLALGGHITGVQLPQGYAETTLDPERVSILNITMN